jgi:hypothetical protein
MWQIMSLIERVTTILSSIDEITYLYGWHIDMSFFNVKQGKRENYLISYDSKQRVLGCHLTTVNLWMSVCDNLDTVKNLIHHFINPGGYTNIKTVHPTNLPDMNTNTYYTIFSCRILLGNAPDNSFGGSHIFIIILSNTGSSLYYATYSSELGESVIDSKSIHEFLHQELFIDPRYATILNLLAFIMNNNYVCSQHDLNSNGWESAFGISCLGENPDYKRTIGVTYTVNGTNSNKTRLFLLSCI